MAFESGRGLKTAELHEAAGPDYLAELSGQRFLQALVEWMQRTYGVAIAVIGQLELGPVDRMRIVAMKAASPEVSFQGYPLSDTVCECVVREGQGHCQTRDALKKFPDSDFLRQYAIESYASAPVFDSTGAVAGVFWVAGQEPRPDAEAMLQDLLRFAPRVGAELEAMARLATLTAIVEASALSGTPDAFRRLVNIAQTSLRARACFIGEAIADNPDHFRILAYSHQGQLLKEAESVVCSYAGTPCAGLQQQDKVVHESGVRHCFPENETLQAITAEGYVGIALKDGDGVAHGHLALIHDRPIGERVVGSTLLEVLAKQATVELARVHALEAKRLAEQRIVAAEKMESLGLMAGGVAHDFNNLLVGILGNAELAADLLPKQDRAGRLLRDIEERALEARDVVKQLLDYAGRDLAPDHQALDLDAIVADGVDLVPRAAFPDARVDVERAEERPGVSGCGVQLVRVVANLLLNALEALPEGKGSVRISARRVTLTKAERAALLFGGDSLPDRCVVLEVRDEGPGIAAGDLGRVLDPFFSRKPQGRGLGLAIVQGTLRAHHGGLMIESLAVGGTSVRAYLAQASDRPSPAEAERPEAEKGGEAGRALLVDDQAEVRQVIGLQLKALGFTVTAHGSGRGAIEQLASGAPYQVLLLDLTMPEMDGWTALDRLRKTHPDLPVLLMSGFTDSETAHRTLSSGRTAFLAKPFRRAQLATALGGLLGWG